MRSAELPMFVGNRPVAGDTWLEVHDKFTDDRICRVAQAGPQQLEHAIAAAAKAAEPMRRLPAHARRAVLDHVVKRLDARADELARSLCAEAGKSRV